MPTPSIFEGINPRGTETLIPCKDAKAQNGVIANTKLIKDTVGWSGKNLLAIKLSELKTRLTDGTWSGNTYSEKNITLTFEVNANGYVTTITGGGGSASSTANIVLIPRTSPTGLSLPTGKYKTSGTPNSIPTECFVRYFCTRDGSSYVYGDDTGNGVVCNILNTDIVGCLISVKSGQSINGLVFNLMLRNANILNDAYEPYRGTTAFPRDEQRELGARNINATDYSKASALTNITATFNNDGTITANGTTTANESLAGGSAANFKAWYTGSVRIASAPENVLMTLYDATAGANVGTAGQTCNMTAGHDYRLSITFLANKTFTNVVVNPLIVLATDLDDTPAPYAMTNRELTDEKINCDSFAPIEKTDKASANLHLGQYIVKDGFICTVTGGDVSQGDDWIENTNYYKKRLYRSNFIPDLPNGYDLNNIIITNEYYCGSASKAQSIVNRPSEITQGFRLIHVCSFFEKGSGEAIQSAIQKIELVNNSTPVIYMRIKPYNSNWSSWYKFTGTALTS